MSAYQVQTIIRKICYFCVNYIKIVSSRNYGAEVQHYLQYTGFLTESNVWKKRKYEQKLFPPH